MDILITIAFLALYYILGLGTVIALKTGIKEEVELEGADCLMAAGFPILLFVVFFGLDCAKDSEVGNMRKFNWDEFKNKDNRIAVHCKTKEEAVGFCKQMHEHGMKWCTGDSYLENTNYNVHNEGTCYYGIGEYSSRVYAEKYNYKILEWSDYMQKEFTKADLKDGMVVEYNDNCFGKRLVIGGFLIGEDGYDDLVNYNENLKNVVSDLEIVRVYKIKCMGEISSIMKDHNLELIWERKEPKKMTVEEMRQKLEELTGEEIEVMQE